MEIKARGLHARLGLLFALAFLACAALWSPSARAESWGQYLIVVDDSKSMDGSDPDRLVILASMALDAALGEGDQVMLVGLNELADGRVAHARFSSPEQLLDGVLAKRDGPEGVEELQGELGAHEGGTPCARALDQARTILEEVSAAGVHQTLLMLTDGECNGGAIEPAQRWLDGLTSHQRGGFRFVLLRKRERGKTRVDPTLAAYATATGWTADPTVSFDARSLLHAFVEVLSFSRDLRYDDGLGLSRSFAGAREVRVLAVSTDGEAPIDLRLTDAGMDSRDEPLAGGPTFRHQGYGWSLRTAKTGPRMLPFSVRSPNAGVEVLTIPRYGNLRVEAVIGTCPDETQAGQADQDEAAARPALPWTHERSVRSGQPACAWARLVGDVGETIDPQHSLRFTIELCEDEACTSPTAMQPHPDGTFNAQLGVLTNGRHERTFRATGASLALPVSARRGVQASAFGITTVARADKPDVPLESIELGVLPQALPTVLTLQVSGSFPEAGQAEVSCTVTGDAGAIDPLAGELPCLRCVPSPATVDLQDPFSVQVEIHASNFCPLISSELSSTKSDPNGDAKGDAKEDAGPRELPVALDLVIAGTGSAAGLDPRRLPIIATLRHATAAPQTASVTGGETAQATLSFPAPVSAKLELSLEPDDPDAVPEGLRPTLAETEQQIHNEGPGETASVQVELTASDCCSAGDYPFSLVVRDAAGGPYLSVPVTISVAKPSFWVCPGKTIAKWAALALGVGFLIWLVRGFTSPAKFAKTAVLARAESHNALSKLGEGDEDWRLVQSLEPTKRGFYTPATVHLGGSKAALPSLRGLPDDARIEARDNENATLVVEAEGVEQFRESTGWQIVPVGEQPIGSNVVLRRDDTYLMFRR
ncbi:VWA domain-containing protein [Pseudenhygromyxa sp. WMMC2535]|uniref:vWA domain-containing protein n=1 Tax=Pseudenhygromyxa sp. WMMC2535 TaxID=2712867 RepID=UPI0015540C55|nr:vWA domain-containing protein [Pseudenhygromyxa sp. WMMC2535]NVB40386.1 VWA domain-containing protein [Pseudenhygromyxa sp. WMMC2535]